MYRLATKRTTDKKPRYRKDNRAMRPIYEYPEISV